jgi:peroxiredoxin Q/BCP
VTVLGASPDAPAAQSAFRAKYALPFRLLCDADHRLAVAYGSWVEKERHGTKAMGLDRSTFLVGKDGRVERAWRGVKVDGHVAEVLAEARRGA